MDSALAARLLLDQGIEVVGLHLESPTACRTDVRAVARELGIEIVARPKGEEYLKLLRAPRFGYGRNMNPCIDCRIFMFQRARAYLDEFGAQFLFTGEVLGQRPMSQLRASIALIDRHSGIAGLILRPLSARLLEETQIERRGWVDRERLLGICGRTRTAQLELAARYGLTAHQSPGGGCLLTDPHYARKLRDFFEAVPAERTTVDDLALLRIGRHFRSPEPLIILGRSADENRRLSEFATAGRWLVEPVGFSGPTALVCGPETPEVLERAAALIVGHARHGARDGFIRWGRGSEFLFRSVEPAPAEASAPIG